MKFFVNALVHDAILLGKRVLRPSHVPGSARRVITREFTIQWEKQFVSRTERTIVGAGDIGERFVGSQSFNGDLVPIPIQCAPSSKEASFDDGKRSGFFSQSARIARKKNRK